MKRNHFQPWRVASAGGMSLLLFAGQTAPLLGNPTGGAVVAGGATIGAAGPTLTINQSTQSAIINWQTFSITNGETTKFIVPNSGAATLNRVVGGNPSAIYGNLQSNGILYLVNPSGIVVGPNGRIDTAGFMASTLDVSNEQFLKGGDLTFAGTSDAAINNAGTIHASTGDVYLIANQVNNTGTISAPQGNVGLAAGNEVLFQQAGNQHLFVQATPAGTKRATGVTNAGTIRAAAAELKAAGGNAYALAINNTGVIAATGYKKVNGQVYLTSDGGSITNSGKISAKQANGNGGTIALTGTSSTTTASKNTVTNSGTLNVSATKAGGTGGTISVKNMTGATIHSGALLAQGGQGGAGGDAEVSGETLGFTGTVDFTSIGGTTGNLLLDPATLTVITGGTGSVISGQNDAATTIDPTTVSVALSLSNVILNANTNITITNGITWTSTNTLSLSTNTTGSTININAPLSGVNGRLVLNPAGSTDVITPGAAGSINVSTFFLQSGDWNQLTASLPAFTASHGFVLNNPSTFLRATGGTGSNSTPYTITDVYGLQGMATFLGNIPNRSFQLANNIDATVTSAWGSSGFVPIGNSTNQYQGSLNGAGFVIDHLFINFPADTEPVGLIGYANGGLINNLGLTNANITGGSNATGGLIGFANNCTVQNDYVTGTVNASTSVGDDTGGLIGGINLAIVEDCYSGASVTGKDVVGGLIGVINSGTVQDSYAYGNVTGNGEVGGLVGSSLGQVNTSYSSGLVTGTTNVGGFMGLTTVGGGASTANDFWDITTSGQTIGVGANPGTGVTGYTTNNLLNQSTYTGWSIGTDPTATNWVIFNGATRPMLSMEYSHTINTTHQLQLIGINSTTSAATYTIAQTIDASGTSNASDVWGTSTSSGKGFDPIGTGGNVFSGNLNGQGNAINFLYINNTSLGEVGLFGELNGASVSNVGLAVANITGNDYTGALAGISDLSSISKCYSYGTVTGGGTGFGTGGLVGLVQNGGSISQSYSSATVNGAVPTGGLVGTNEGVIQNSYSSGSVHGTMEVGGLVGDNNVGGSIIDSYSTAAVSGPNSVGGLIGNNGGGTISNSYWDTDTAGVTQGDGTNATQSGITGNTTAQLESTSFSPPTWNFSTVWSHVAGNTPQLIGLPQTSPPMGSPTFDVLTGNAFTDSGITAAGANLTIDALSGGIIVGTTTTTTGGGFTFNLSFAQVSSGVLLTDPTDSGNTYYQANTPTNTTTGIDIWGSTVRTSSDNGSNAMLAAAAGSITTAGVQYTVNATGLMTNAGVNIDILRSYNLTSGLYAHDITVEGSIGSNNSATTILSATRNITINGSMDKLGGPGGYSLISDSGGTGVGTVTFGTGAAISTPLPVTIFYNPSVNPAGSAVNTTSYANPTENYSADVNGGGTLTAYMLVNTLNDLQNVQNNPSGTYALSKNIDATPTAGWNSGAGFVPIANNTTNFTGTFYGQNFVINGLTINRPSTPFVGLFGATGSGAQITNVGLTNEQVTGDYQVGGLVGLNNFGTVTLDYVDGSINATGFAIGGGSSANSAGFVTELGGLVGGNNQGAISQSYTTGSVTGPSSGGGNMGGLVGENFNGGSISNSYSLANVSGSLSVGGLVGGQASYNGTTSTISDTYSAGFVVGTGAGQGGLVGYSANGPVSISASFWDTQTSGQLGGLGTGTTTGITAATSAQLMSQSFIAQNAPSFDFTHVWTTVSDTRAPQLIGLPQTTLPAAAGDSLSGTAYLDSGVTAAGAGLTIDALSGGIIIGTTSTTSGGGFTFTLTNAQLTGGVLLTDATDNGNTYYQVNSASGSVTGIDIWGATLRVVGDTATFASLATAKGSLTNGVNYTYNGNLFSTTAGVNLNILSDFGLNGVVAANDITINHALTANTPNLSVLTAYRNLTVNANITNTGTGGVTLQSDTIGNGVGTVAFSGGAKVSTAGPITIFYNPSVNPQGSAVNATSYANPTENYAADVAGGGTLTAYMLVNTLNDLQNVKNNLTGTYALSQNIDATPTAGWNSGAGFVPLGLYDYSDSSDTNTFRGILNGQGHTINGLTINLPASISGTGLFGDTATTSVVENVNLTNASIIGGTYVGALTGVDNATLTNVTSSGTVTGTTYVGGLAGISFATVMQSSTAGTVSGNNGGSDVGGLIGFMQGGTTTNTFSTAAVSGYGSAGGLVGNNRGTIQLSYSTGAVTANTGFNGVGGLVGYNSAGTIEQSYSTSAVTAIGTGQYLGGLAGFNALTIDDSYATGPVTGFSGAIEVGGLVGGNFDTIHNTYSTGLVTANGATDVGGFAGKTTTTIENSFFDTDSSGQIFAIGNDSTNVDVTAAATAQLKTQSFITAHATVSPTFNFPTVWTTVGDTLTPQLVGLPQTALPAASGPLDVIDGTAFTDNEGLNISSGVLVELISGGSVLGSTTTSNGGTFTFNVSAGALMNGILLTDPTDKGNTFYEAMTPAMTIHGIDLWGSTVRVTADTATNATLGIAIGSLPANANGIAYSVGSGALTTAAGENFTILRNYALDGNITASGVFTTNTAAILTGSANVTLTGASVAMAGTFNRTGALTVASTTGQILLNGVGTLATPATAPGLTLTSAQAILTTNTFLTLGSGGFTATGTGYTSNVDANGEANGINLFDTTINSSGNISLSGTAGYTIDGNGGLQAGQGVDIGTDGVEAEVLNASGSANLTITGTFNRNIASSSLLNGVYLFKDITQSVNTLSVADGRLTINGTVSQGSTTADVKGVGIETGVVVQATGAGLVAINGISSATSATNLIGAEVTGGTVSVVDGTLNVNGTVTRGTAASSIGVNLIQGADVSATGAGSVMVTGNTTGSSASFNAGFYSDGATLTSSGASGLAVTGDAGAVTGANPVTLDDGVTYNPTSAGLLFTLGSSLSTTNTGGIRLIGVAGPNDSTAPINAYGSDTGVRFEPSGGTPVTVTSAGGGIAITGTSGAGAGTFFNVGVNVSTVHIQDTGDGAVTVTGFGGAGQTDNSGVAIEGTTTSIQAGNGGGSSGVLTIIGHGATGAAGSQNDGISIFNTAQLVSGGGGIVITGNTGTPGNGSSGVLISTASVTTPNGPLAVSSTGGGLSIGATITALTTAYSTPAGASATLSNLNGTTTLSGGNFFITQSGNLVLNTTSVQSLTLDVTGAITQVGRVSAGQLAIVNASSVTLTDPTNVIASLGAVNSGGGFDFFTDPGLTLTNTVTSGGPITIAETGGPLTIAPTGSVIETGTATIILAAGTDLANSNYFINQAGANAVQTGSFGRFFLFSSDPMYDDLGGITFAPANMVYNAIYPTSATSFSGGGNAEFFYVAGMGQVGPNSPANSMVPNTATGGAAGGGSNIVPVVLTTQNSDVAPQGSVDPATSLAQVFPQIPIDGTPGNAPNYLPNGGANADGTQPPAFSFTGTGVSQLQGQNDGGLANSTSNSGRVIPGDTAQLGNGQYGNASNPQAADVLNEALGPIVYANLAEALKSLGDWADVPDAASDPAAGSGETILTGGDVAEMTGTTAKKIPLSQAPEQLQNAMKDDSLKGAGHP